MLCPPLTATSRGGGRGLETAISKGRAWLFQVALGSPSTWQHFLLAHRHPTGRLTPRRAPFTAGVQSRKQGIRGPGVVVPPRPASLDGVLGA